MALGRLLRVMHRRPPSSDPYAEDALEAAFLSRMWELTMELESLAPQAPIPDPGVSEEDFYL